MTSNPTLRYLLKINENPSPPKDLYANVHSSTIYNSFKLKVTYAFINWSTDKL